MLNIIRKRSDQTSSLDPGEQRIDVSSLKDLFWLRRAKPNSFSQLIREQNLSRDTEAALTTFYNSPERMDQKGIWVDKLI
jgi:hypothetical protein